MGQLKTFDQTFDRSPTTETAAGQWLEDRLTRVANQGIFSEVIQLNPILAKHFLKHNRDNRPLRKAKLKQFADDIVYDRWDFNGEPIIFADTGEMNDGQHRCEAVIMAGKPILTLVVYGVKRESRRTVDNGSARAPGDHLAVEGKQYALEMASIARFVLAYERSGGTKLSDSNRISATEIVDRAMEDEGIDQAATLAKMAYGKFRSVAPPSVLGFCYYQFAKANPEAAEEFMRSVISGANLSEDSPAYVVREKLISLERPLREHRAEILFQGFKAYVEERTLGRIVVRNEFPTLSSLPTEPEKKTDATSKKKAAPVPA